MSAVKAPRPQQGFTLVEVLVALFVMALMAAMAWQGVDSIVRSRDISGAQVDRLLRLNTVLAQWESDLSSLEETLVVPTLAFDGAAVRLTRRVEEGVQIVTWSLREGQWLRWTSPVATRSQALQDGWLRSLQLLPSDPGQLRTVSGVADWQVYFFRGNGWSNAQSSDDLAPPPAVVGGDASATGLPRVQLPSGVRIVMTFAEGSGLSGTLTRDIRLGPQAP
jgi:general secretion pathway protein J